MPRSSSSSHRRSSSRHLAAATQHHPRRLRRRHAAEPRTVDSGRAASRYPGGAVPRCASISALGRRAGQPDPVTSMRCACRSVKCRRRRLPRASCTSCSCHFERRGSFGDHPFAAITADAKAVLPLPPIWLLGSSGFSAQLAAMPGLGVLLRPPLRIRRHDACRRRYDLRAGTSSPQPSPPPQPHLILACVRRVYADADADGHAARLAPPAIDRGWRAAARSRRYQPLPAPRRQPSARSLPMEPRDRIRPRRGFVLFVRLLPVTVDRKLDARSIQRHQAPTS